MNYIQRFELPALDWTVAQLCWCQVKEINGINVLQVFADPHFANIDVKSIEIIHKDK